MPVCELSVFQLCVAGILIILLAGASLYESLGLTKTLLINTVRCVVQLSLIGIVLNWLFTAGNAGFIMLMMTVMIGMAGWEIQSRQKERLRGFWAYMIGTGSLMMSSVLIAFLTLGIVLQMNADGNTPSPWYDPRYSIPLLGMILGNTMTGIALGIDRLSTTVKSHREMIEQRLLLGDMPSECIAEFRRDAIRAAMIPSINTMAVTGIVSLPGMMTGQILAGNSPAMAAKYQILIMFLIVAGAGFGTILATKFVAAHLFDPRMRLRLDRFRDSK